MRLIRYAYIAPTREAAQAIADDELRTYPHVYACKATVTRDDSQAMPWRIDVERYNSAD